MMKIFGGSSPVSSQDAAPPFVLLVVQADAYDWPSIFKGATVNGRAVQVYQTGWKHIVVGPVDNYSREKKRRCAVRVLETTEYDENGIKTGGTLKPPPTVFPDMLLVRNVVRGHQEDWRNTLFGLMYAGVPAVNSLHSIHMASERILIQAELNGIRDAVGEAVFPVIDQAFAPNVQGMMYPLGFPAVVKVGAAHAGFGKMKVRDHHDMSDFRSVLAMTEGKYCTMEPFIEGDHDIRVQCIGGSVRAFKRQSVSGDWKTNTGTSLCEEIAVTPAFRRWVELVQPLFGGGMDIFTIDAIYDAKTERYKILEVNDTSSGLFPETADADNEEIKRVVLERAEAL